MLRIILDTNILVSAVHRSGSDPDLILNIALDKQAGLITLCASQAIMEEYQEVLSRDKFRYLDRAKINHLLTQIKKICYYVLPSKTVDLITIDPTDNKFLECALEAQADFLITGNIRHFPFKKFQRTRIVTPKEFIHQEIIKALFHCR